MKKYLFLLLVLTACFLEADSQKPTICLNMIIKDETQVICRCLESVKPLIDYWVIVDTGSSDGTQDLVKEFMKDIPGELHERPWKNFEHNRNEALELGKDKGDYLLIIDADDKLVIDPNFVRPTLDKDFYTINIEYGNLNYQRTQLIKTSLPWRWEGVLHEVLVSPIAATSADLEGVTMKIVGGGGRSQDPIKFLKDAMVLEKALQEKPNHARYTFYLAQSYRDARFLDKAIEVYEKRVSLGGWDQEVFWSLYQIALAKEDQNAPEEDISKAYERAFLFRPTRTEPLYRLCEHYRKKDHHLLAYLISKQEMRIQPTSDILFVESWMYDWGILFQYSICTYWVEKYEESHQACLELLKNPRLPDHIRAQVNKNLLFVLDSPSIILT